MTTFVIEARALIMLPGPDQPVGAATAGVPDQRTQPEDDTVFRHLPAQFRSPGSGSPRLAATPLSATFAALYLAWFGLSLTASTGSAAGSAARECMRASGRSPG